MAPAGTPIEQRHEATRHAMRWLIPNPRLDGVAAVSYTHLTLPTILLV